MKSKGENVFRHRNEPKFVLSCKAVVGSYTCEILTRRSNHLFGALWFEFGPSPLAIRLQLPTVTRVSLMDSQFQASINFQVGRLTSPCKAFLSYF